MIRPEEIGKNIKKYRKKAGYTQAELANRIGISKVHMSHMEGGSVSMSIESLLKLCEALQITPNHLLLADYQAANDSTILSETLQELTEDEVAYIVKTIDLLREMNLNKD